MPGVALPPTDGDFASLGSMNLDAGARHRALYRRPPRVLLPGLRHSSSGAVVLVQQTCEGG